MKKRDFKLLFICFSLTHVLSTMYDMWLYENLYFLLLALFLCIVCFIVTIILYFKNPKLITRYPAFVCFSVFSISEMIFGENYKYRDFLGFITVVAAVITLINVVKNRERNKEPIRNQSVDGSLIDNQKE